MIIFCSVRHCILVNGQYRNEKRKAKKVTYTIVLFGRAMMHRDEICPLGGITHHLTLSDKYPVTSVTSTYSNWCSLNDNCI